MGTRPLRQFYDTDRSFVGSDGLDLAALCWRHRERLADALAGFDEADWKGPTRCSEWNVRDVVLHLNSATGYFAWSMARARDGAGPGRLLAGFDPSTTPAGLVAGMGDRPVDEALGELRNTAVALRDVASTMTDEQWDRPAESPFGHMPARMLLHHSYWDSWLHERDILVPRGEEPAPDEDELEAMARFTLLLGGVQGGLPDDDEPVADGAPGPIDVTVMFDDLPGRPLRVQVGHDVAVTPGPDGHAAQPAGSALDLVEGAAGRAPLAPVLDRLPDVLAAQVRRAADVI